MKQVVLLFCIVGTIISCNSSKNVAKLGGVKWVLQTLNNKKVGMTDQNSDIYIQFDEIKKSVNGRGGCNRFFGNYEINGNKLKFSPMGATRMACPDLQLENEFFKMLETVDTYSIKENTLSFLSEGQTVATFKKTAEEKKEN